VIYRQRDSWPRARQVGMGSEYRNYCLSLGVSGEGRDGVRFNKFFICLSGQLSRLFVLANS